MIDLVDVARRHSLQAAPVLYGLPPGLITKGEPLAKLAEELEALAEKFAGFDIEKALQNRLTLAQLQAQATTFDVWSVPSLGAVADVVTMNWIQPAAGLLYRLSYPWEDGTETLTVGPDLLGHFDVSATYRSAPAPGGLYLAARQRTLVAGVPTVAAALMLAETFVREQRGSVSRLKDREAPWRKRPASVKQIALLARMRIPHNPKGLTMGGASDLIDLSRSRRTR